MDVKLVDRGTEGELILSGRIDTRTAGDAEVIFLQTADKFRDVTLNFRDVKYVSSAGLRALQKLYLKVRNNGGELYASNVPQSISDVMEMVGLSDLFIIK